MLKKIWRTIENYSRLEKGQSLRTASKNLGIPKSTIRATSQTEGRNGHLAFINHAYRGFPKNRLQVLTVIHNYDVRRKDGKTSTQRLFRKEFPDLFEFICLNVAEFKEPRRRKP